MRGLLAGNRAVLFLCVSMYLGTGWSLLLFSFPVASRLDTSNYWMQFVPQVTAATRFFTGMTAVMLVSVLIMLVERWRTSQRWVPIVVLLGIVAATLLTTSVILPLNEEMRRGIHDESRLREVLARWMRLNQVRVGLWTVQWGAMMSYYLGRDRAAR